MNNIPDSNALTFLNGTSATPPTTPDAQPVDQFTIDAIHGIKRLDALAVFKCLNGGTVGFNYGPVNLPELRTRLLAMQRDYPEQVAQAVAQVLATPRVPRAPAPHKLPPITAQEVAQAEYREPVMPAPAAPMVGRNVLSGPHVDGATPAAPVACFACPHCGGLLEGVK